MEAVHFFDVLENCAVCLAALQEITKDKNILSQKMMF